MKKTLLAAAATLSIIAASTPANAASFMFSFGSDQDFIDNLSPIDAIVTGRILGLTDNATSSAAQVFIDSFSAGPFSGIPVDAASWDSQVENSFTLVNGVMTGASFLAGNGFFGNGNLDVLSIGYLGGPVNYASVGVNNDVSVRNFGGLGAVTFTVIGGAVPEPATWAFMIFGFGAIGGAMRRQRKANVKVSYA